MEPTLELDFCVWGHTRLVSGSGLTMPKGERYSGAVCGQRVSAGCGFASK